MLILASAALLQSQEPASLHGAVRDSQGKPIVGATVELRPSGATQPQTTHTDSLGAYSSAALRGGVYDLHATMAGYRDVEITAIFVAPNEEKTLDVTLPAAKELEFFDQSRFTVSGVTDTTSLGGHGSGAVIHAREALVNETVSLGKVVPAADSVASDTEKSLRDGVAREPRSFELNHRLGKLLVEGGRGSEAMAYLNRAAELQRGDYENSLELALANLETGHFALARSGAQALLAHYDKAELHHLAADAEEKLGNSLVAVREYERAAELDPREPNFFDWGSELLLHHAPEPAVEVFERGNHLHPHSIRLLIGLAAAWFVRGSYDLAVQRICEASDLDPNDPTPYIFMGKMQAAEPEPPEKIVENLRRFLALHPDHAEANYYYASSLWKLRRGVADTATTERVESLLKNAIRLDPKLGAAHLQLGLLHFEQKDFPTAVSEFQNAIRGDSQGPVEEAHFHLAQAYRRMGNEAGADAEFQIYRELAKQSAKQAERERREIPQFVYTLRGQPSPQAP